MIEIVAFRSAKVRSGFGRHTFAERLCKIRHLYTMLSKWQFISRCVATTYDIDNRR